MAFYLNEKPSNQETIISLDVPNVKMQRSDATLHFLPRTNADGDFEAEAYDLLRFQFHGHRLHIYKSQHQSICARVAKRIKICVLS
jgi:hypothetical protein